MFVVDGHVQDGAEQVGVGFAGDGAQGGEVGGRAVAQDEGGQCGNREIGCAVAGGTLHTTSEKARTDWRTDYEHIEYGTVDVPEDIATAVRRFLAYYGIVFGSFDFAVTPAGDWVFFENNPSGTWAWVENRTGLPIAAAHADYLRGTCE
ncbi:hypothetical protein ACFYWH_42165 [Streptomyces sp. NPDC003737]|uniref:hypothetical protein n=1 Tax=Streptomyces sp. NPDC003737 TaxID=3364685 RepID=UPI0036C51829